MQVAVKNCQLVDKNGAKNKTLSSQQPFCGHGTMNIENSLEVFVEVFNRNGAGFVQDLTYFDTIIMMWVRVVFAGK